MNCPSCVGVTIGLVSGGSNHFKWVIQDTSQIWTFFDRQAMKWRKEMSTHSITLPLSRARFLLQYLANSTKQLPKTMRKHDTFWVSLWYFTLVSACLSIISNHDYKHVRPRFFYLLDSITISWISKCRRSEKKLKLNLGQKLRYFDASELCTLVFCVMFYVDSWHKICINT